MQEVFRVVRMSAAQPSCRRLALTIEAETAALLQAKSARVFLVQHNCLRTYSHLYSFPHGMGIVGAVHKSRETALLSKNPADDKRYDSKIDGFPDSKDLPNSLLAVPVLADIEESCSGPKDVVGVILFLDKDTGFTSQDAAVVESIAGFVGNMLRNFRNSDRKQAAFEDALKGGSRQAALLEVARALATETKLKRLVSLIVKQVPKLLDADRCTLFFVDKEKEQLIATKGASHGREKTLLSWIFGQSNAPELPFPEGADEIRFTMKRGLAGHVATTGETLNILDAHLDKRFNPKFDEETGYRTRSILCVPLIDERNIIIGVLQVINKNPMYPGFDASDQTLAKTFSSQAALAVRNSQLFEKTKRALQQSDAMLEITTALSQELDIEKLTKLVCVKVQDLLSAERCTVFIVEAAKNHMYTSSMMSHGMGPSLPIDKEKAKLIYFPLNRGIAGSVATTGQTINIPDAYEDPRFNKAMDMKTGFRTRSILCMSIVNNRNEIVGVLQCMNKCVKGQYRAFNSEDESLVQAFCAQAAVAIENSRLFLQTERALNHALRNQRNLKFQISVTKNLFSDMHLTSMIRQLTMQVHHLLKADDCALYLVDNKTNEFYMASAERGAAKSKRFKFDDGIVGLVAKTGETVRISSQAHRHPNFHQEVDQRKGKVSHSILCCPIKAEVDKDKNKIIGVISVRDEKDRGGFEQEEVKLLKVFSAQAAVAISSSTKFAAFLDNSDLKNVDMSAADYLKAERGMQLASDDIDTFQFRMDDIDMKGAIGTGSYGDVYRAVVKGRTVAVKKLHVRNLKVEQIDAFCKEASLMCQLHHPNIVGFIGAVTEPSNLCIITEFCARGSLADLLLDESIEMDFMRKLRFCLESAQGMLYLHQSNPVILHRDLKSDNLLITKDWVVKVADFGLTRFMSEKKAMTQVGTPMWMAPEIIMGKTYTEKADVYAFGIIMWEILTRMEPYEDKEPMQIVVEVVNDNLRPTIPAEFKDNELVPLMKDCWARKPDDRPTFKVVTERLEKIEIAEKKRLAKLQGPAKKTAASAATATAPAGGATVGKATPAKPAAAASAAQKPSASAAPSKPSKA